MGFLPGVRFRKSIKVLPGVRVNLSKTGVSTSVGGRGASVNVGSQGTRTVNVGIPGTGLSYRVQLNAFTLIVVIALVAIAALLFWLAPGTMLALLAAWGVKLY